jgi:hypothetical protein
MTSPHISPIKPLGLIHPIDYHMERGLVFRR